MKPSFTLLVMVAATVATAGNPHFSPAIRRHNHLQRRRGLPGCEIQSPIAIRSSTIRVLDQVSTARTTTQTASAPTTASSTRTQTTSNASPTQLPTGGASGPCGDRNPTSPPTANGGPNGSFDYLTCGITSTGWIAPPITLSDIVTAALDTTSPDSPFQNCNMYRGLFETYGQRLGVPPIILASFAMQESSCMRNARGPAGEIGLMQITADKCTDPYLCDDPSICANPDCYEPSRNIYIGARFFVTQLASHGNNLPRTMGGYNGWSEGMTVNSVSSLDCHIRPNLDYIHQMLNGWFMGIDPRARDFYHYRQLLCQS